MAAETSWHRYKRNYVTVILCIFATVGGQFITLSVRRCLQYDARKAARCAGPSATPNTCRIVLYAESDFIIKFL